VVIKYRLFFFLRAQYPYPWVGLGSTEGHPVLAVDLVSVVVSAVAVDLAVGLDEVWIPYHRDIGYYSRYNI
jgi:hypothetical protein